MKDYKLLLERFWNNTASETEKLQLYKIVVEDEDAIKKALQQEFEEGNKPQLQSETSKRMLESLHKEIGNRASNSIEMPRKSLGLFKWAAALLAIGFASFFAWRVMDVHHTERRSNAIASSFQKIDNNGTTIKNVVMEDGTFIQLYPNSQLQFSSSFNTQEVRSIQLKGKADFKVKHNAAKAFEVIANNIKTTDIGTEFCVDASDEKAFNVILKEGSISVVPMPSSNLKIQERILKAGDELHLDLVSNKITLAQVSKASSPKAETQDSPVIPKERLVFNKATLTNVFAGLEAREHVEIHFKKEEIKDLTFTGAIESTDNIETALNIICNLNGLSYHKTKHAFTIVKSK
jgi:ferric-dicitrate binding protein FerR (iron transport regulator)